jgi:dolichol kinase
MLRRHEINNFTGASYLLVSAIFCIAFFPPDIAFLAMAFLSIGDTFAALIGIHLGKRKFKNSKKSFEGTLACFISTFLFGYIYLQLPFVYNHEYSHPAIALSGAASASIAELLNIPIDDNVKIPIISGIIMWFTYYICGGFGI